MKLSVAAYQASLATADPHKAIAEIRRQLDRCEEEGVSFLCCPEAVLGGLADFAATPSRNAVGVADGELAALVAPLRSRTVTTILGFTERAEHQQLFNAAAVLHRGKVLGVYRKNRPAIRTSVYSAGTALPVFRAGRVTFGILICNDSNFPDLARSLVAQGAQIIFIPSNNGLPPKKADVVVETRRIDAAIARANNVTVVRADVAGRTEALLAHGTSAVTGPDGVARHIAPTLLPALLVAALAVQVQRGERALSPVLERPYGA